jgi:DnaJ-like protein
MDISIDQAVNASDILSIIKSHPEGLKEYDLLMAMYEPLPLDERPNISDSLTLFQQHFWLFHILYRLQDHQHFLQQGHLQIDPLKIQWLPYSHQSASRQDLTIDDPLRRYYLDLDNLKTTQREDVDTLLSSFWLRIVDDSDKQAALDCLGLPADTDYKTIKQRYRKLLSDAHPDRGGSHEEAQALNKAMEYLKRCYKS